jgi:hypothetical protein
MDIRRRASGVALAAVLLVTAAPARTVLAQTVSAPPPTAEEQRNAAIVRPLVEIGRVRARTPYCAALASARPGIDAAVAFEYQAPVLANDIKHFRYDSALHQHLAMRKTQADLTLLWHLAVAGREEVRALRTAANADGMDEQKRAEMLALANAVDGAKARQYWLAKSIARTLAVYSEAPVRTVASSAEDDLRASNPFNGSSWSPGNSGSLVTSSDPTPPPSLYSQLHPDAMQEHELAQSLFSTFASERFIRDDMEVAAKHAKTAMQLGGCSST